MQPILISPAEQSITSRKAAARHRHGRVIRAPGDLRRGVVVQLGGVVVRARGCRGGNGAAGGHPEARAGLQGQGSPFLKLRWWHEELTSQSTEL
jgi:hypothetical protein